MEVSVKTSHFVIFVILLALCACVPQAAVESAAVPVGAQELALVNPGFEGDYVTVPGGYAAYGWATFYKEGTKPPLADFGGGDNPTRRPEFKPIEAKFYPERVADGDKAQVAFAFFGIMDAAFSQQVAVQPGQRVQFSVQGHGWSTDTDDPTQHTGEVYVSLGIGAEGQTWPWEHGIVWRRYNWTLAEYKTYTSREVVAEADRVTLFVLVTNKWAAKHNDFYLDDAHAWIVADGGDCPECPACPSPEPCPTGTYPSIPPCPTCPPSGGEGCDENAIAQAVVDALRGLKWRVGD